MLKTITVLFTIAMPFVSSAAEIGDNGLHTDPLFNDTFLGMSEDATDAAAEGKTLMVIVEQRGCPYCAEMHEVNFARDDIRAEIAADFYPVQLDLFGSRAVTDFDGEELEEREFVTKHAINFTPTTLFFDAEGNELFRMPGYFKPFHHISALEYVAAGKTDQPFQRFLQDKFADLEAQGIDPKVWE